VFNGDRERNPDRSIDKGNVQRLNSVGNQGMRPVFCVTGMRMLPGSGRKLASVHATQFLSQNSCKKVEAGSRPRWEVMCKCAVAHVQWPIAHGHACTANADYPMCDPLMLYPLARPAH
jgi:hypothetical protein